MKKQLVLDVIQNLPEAFSIEELISRIKFIETMFIETMERGRQQYLEGKTLTHEEAMQRLEKRRQK